MPCSANATSARRSSLREETTSSSPRATNPGCKSTSAQASATKKRPGQWRPPFPPEGQAPAPPARGVGRKGGQGERRAGGKEVTKTTDLDLPPEVAGASAGLEANPQADHQGQNHGGSDLRDNQPEGAGG